MKKKILAIVLCVAMLAIAVVGGSLAYFTDTDADTNVMTAGKVSIRQDEWMRDGNGGLTAYQDPDTILPAVLRNKAGKVYALADLEDQGFSWNGWHAEDETVEYTVPGLNDTFYMIDNNRMENVVDKIVTVTNDGVNDAYVRTILLIEDPTGSVNANIEFLVDYVWDLNEIGRMEIAGTNYHVWEFIYPNAIAQNETTLPSLMAFWVNPYIDQGVLPDNFNIIAYSQAVQADGFKTAEEALDAAFGDVTTANSAWYITK